MSACDEKCRKPFKPSILQIGFNQRGTRIIDSRAVRNVKNFKKIASVSALGVRAKNENSENPRDVFS